MGIMEKNIETTIWGLGIWVAIKEFKLSYHNGQMYI